MPPIFLDDKKTIISTQLLKNHQNFFQLNHIFSSRFFRHDISRFGFFFKFGHILFKRLFIVLYCVIKVGPRKNNSHFVCLES